jgi:hypothetical protein
LHRLPLTQNLPENYAFIRDNSETACAMQVIEGELDLLWSIYNTWSGLDVYDRLIGATCDAVKATTGLLMTRVGMQTGVAMVR